MTMQITPDHRAGTDIGTVTRTEQAEAATPESFELRWERIAPERYRALRGGRCVGFVDVVGTVFVVLRGARYDRAEEIAQTLDFERVGELLAR